MFDWFLNVPLKVFILYKFGLSDVHLGEGKGGGLLSALILKKRP